MICPNCKQDFDQAKVNGRYYNEKETTYDLECLGCGMPFMEILPMLPRHGFMSYAKPLSQFVFPGWVLKNMEN